MQCNAAFAQPPHQETVESREPVQSRRSSADNASVLTPAQCCIATQAVGRRRLSGKPQRGCAEPRPLPARPMEAGNTTLAHPGARAAAEEEGDAAASSTAWRQIPAVGHDDLRCGRFRSDAASRGSSSVLWPWRRRQQRCWLPAATRMRFDDPSCRSLCCRNGSREVAQEGTPPPPGTYLCWWASQYDTDHSANELWIKLLNVSAPSCLLSTPLLHIWAIAAARHSDMLMPVG